MTSIVENNKRNRLGYGSSYSKGARSDLKGSAGIGTVLGGQVWMVKPDKDAKALDA